MKKQKLSTLALMGIFAATSISLPLAAQNAAGGQEPGYTIYNPNAPVDSKNDIYNGTKGIKEGIVSNSQRSDEVKTNEQVCQGESVPQAGTLPKTLPVKEAPVNVAPAEKSAAAKEAATGVKKSSSKTSLSESSCSSCSSYASCGGKKPATQNSSQLQSKRVQSNR